MPEIRIAVAGIGNCCSSLIQGVEYYKSRANQALGILHQEVAGFAPDDIRFVSAFDIDVRKVGKDLSEAIFSEPNSAPRLANVGSLNTKVLKGPILDGVGEYTKALVHVKEDKAVDVSRILADTGAEILIGLLPSGARDACRFYATEALRASCAFVNATPSAIACDPGFAKSFRDRALPLVGDDLMDQVGATALHMGLLRLLNERGVRIDESYQLDVGGGTESLSTLERGRDTKRKIKTDAVASVIPYRFPLVAGSTDYVDFLGNNRDSLFWVKGRYFCGAPVKIDVKLETVDGPNAGAILLDVIRAVKLAKDRHIGGPVSAVCSYGFKMPPEKLPLDEARRVFDDFITAS